MVRALSALLVVAACGYPRLAPLHGDATGSDGGGPVTPIVITCTGCPEFPGPGSVPSCGGTTAAQLAYPPDGVLLPPNLGALEVQFTQGTNATYYEVDFESATTDVRIETQCTPITDTRGNATGGCGLALDPTAWSDVATTSKGGDPVAVTVRAAPTDLSCVAVSSANHVSFAEQDLTGGLYYWGSILVGGVTGRAGGIYRKDLASATLAPEPFLVPDVTTNRCIGCHFVARDGLAMTYGSDDTDSDDEYGDQHVVLYDVTNHAAVVTNLLPGFQTFSGDTHANFFATDGRGTATMPELVEYSGTTGAGVATLALGASGRTTHPDWSRDGALVYYTSATAITGITGSGGTYSNKDDLHVTNGAIMSAAFLSGQFSGPTPLVTPGGASESDYYPSISPDGTALVFDRAIGTTLATQDSFNNPNAELYALYGTTNAPIALAKANLHSVLTNSWPRWSPAVQTYKGKHIAWVAFSSTRDYGLHVKNEGVQYFNCYPPVSPEDPGTDHSKPFDPDCTQPQIWISAVSLDDLAAGVDGSYPAFWFPFQDFTAHNHSPEWVDTVVPFPTGCATPFQSCASVSCCAGETCNASTLVCASTIP